MTQEEKAKAYDKALERAREYKKYDYMMINVALDNIFPELKESEDERIRKELIKFHKSTIDIDGIKGEQIIAWLEKQGETYTKRDVDDAFVEGMALAKDELEKQGEKKSSDEVLKIRQELYQSGYNDGYKHGCEDTKKQGEQNLANSAKTCKKSQRMVSAEAKEALYDKPAWSDEDDVRLQACLDTLQAKSLMGVVDTKMTKWLKSLKQRIGG